MIKRNDELISQLSEKSKIFNLDGIEMSEQKIYKQMANIFLQNQPYVPHQVHNSVMVSDNKQEHKESNELSNNNNPLKSEQLEPSIKLGTHSKWKRINVSMVGGDKVPTESMKGLNYTHPPLK